MKLLCWLLAGAAAVAVAGAALGQDGPPPPRPAVEGDVAADGLLDAADLDALLGAGRALSRSAADPDLRRLDLPARPRQGRPLGGRQRRPRRPTRGRRRPRPRTGTRAWRCWPAGFPTVVQRMAADLDSTETLGDAVLAQTDDVLDAVQRLRAQAAATGYLESNEAQTVTEGEDGEIAIAPADPEVVYVPSYDPAMAYTTRADGADVRHDRSGLYPAGLLDRQPAHDRRDRLRQRHAGQRDLRGRRRRLGRLLGAGLDRLGRRRVLSPPGRRHRGRRQHRPRSRGRRPRPDRHRPGPDRVARPGSACATGAGSPIRRSATRRGPSSSSGRRRGNVAAGAGGGDRAALEGRLGAGGAAGIGAAAGAAAGAGAARAKLEKSAARREGAAAAQGDDGDPVQPEARGRAEGQEGARPRRAAALRPSRSPGAAKAKSRSVSKASHARPPRTRRRREVARRSRSPRAAGPRRIVVEPRQVERRQAWRRRRRRAQAVAGKARRCTMSVQTDRLRTAPWRWRRCSAMSATGGPRGAADLRDPGGGDRGGGRGAGGARPRRADRDLRAGERGRDPHRRRRRPTARPGASSSRDYRRCTGIAVDGAAAATLYVGRDQWPFPAPLVEGDAGWHFDAAARARGGAAAADRRRTSST